jgi:hypothetical protein
VASHHSHPSSANAIAAGKHLIDGPAGKLEVHVDLADKAAGILAVVCHPHPLYGGTYRNKVVHILAKAFNELGADVVRFNFRGVGESQGQFDDGRGESDDAAAVLQWARSAFSPQHVWLPGFSFGAYVATRLANRVSPDRLLLVAPPASMYDMDGYHDIAMPWLVLQGGDDEVINPQAVRDWVARQSRPPELVWFDGAGHFFHGRLNDLRTAVKERWQNRDAANE